MSFGHSLLYRQEYTLMSILNWLKNLIGCNNVIVFGSLRFHTTHRYMNQLSFVILMIALYATDCFVTYTIWKPVAHLRGSHYYYCCYGFNTVLNQTNVFMETQR